MNTLEQIRKAAVDVAHLSTDMPVIVRRIDEMRAGFPAVASGGSSSASGFDLDELPDEPRPVSAVDSVRLTSVESAAAKELAGKDETANDEDEIERLTAIIIEACAGLRRLTAPYRLPEQTTSAREMSAPDGWCSSCYLDGQHHEPITPKSNGTVHYEGLCRWCGDFRKAYGALPPRALLRARHEGRRISVALVEKHLPKATATQTRVQSGA